MLGSGTSGDPYQIATFSDLEQMGTTGYWKLVANIDASPTLDPGYNGGAGWLPRGSPDTPFTGQLNGNGYVIQNLYINRPTTDYVGLFGYVFADWSTPLKNISVTGNVTGQDYVGMIAGRFMWGTSSDCKGNGVVTGRDRVGGVLGGYVYGHSGLLNPEFKGIVNGRNDIGGIIGVHCEGYPILLDNPSVEVIINITGNNGGCICGRLQERGTIQNCKVLLGSTINASETSDNIGGIVGYSYFGHIVNCTNEIDVKGRDYVGGIVGQKNYDDSIQKCKNTGKITGRNNVAGIAGRAGAGGYRCPMDQNFNSGVIIATGDYVGGVLGWGCVALTNNLNIGSITGVSSVGGLSGYCGEASITNCYSNGKVIGTGTNIGGLIGQPDTSPTHTSATSSYWDLETSGQANSAYGTGKTTAEMKLQSTYVNWDFTSNVWYISPLYNYNYPYLREVPANPTDPMEYPIQLNWLDGTMSGWVSEYGNPLYIQNPTIFGHNVLGSGTGTYAGIRTPSPIKYAYYEMEYAIEAINNNWLYFNIFAGSGQSVNRSYGYIIGIQCDVKKIILYRDVATGFEILIETDLPDDLDIHKIGVNYLEDNSLTLFVDDVKIDSVIDDTYANGTPTNLYISGGTNNSWVYINKITIYEPLNPNLATLSKDNVILSPIINPLKPKLKRLSWL